MLLEVLGSELKADRTDLMAIKQLWMGNAYLKHLYTSDIFYNQS